MKRAVLLLMAGLIMAAGCSEDEPKSSDHKPRQSPTFTPSVSMSTQPGTTLPAGHPPVDGQAPGLPPGHPPMGPMDNASAAGAEQELGIQIEMPEAFERKPPRNTITLRVYAAPRAEGDPEDADITITTGVRVPLEMNIQRWCRQFEFPAGQTCETATQQQTLEGTQYPTTLVEMTGGFKGRMGSGPLKPGFKMVAVEIVTPQQPYFITMVGPEKTVEQWKGPFIDAIKAAK